MVNYPITDFIFDTKDPQAEQLYKQIFQKLNVRSIMVRMGLDYYVSGNAYFSLIMPFKRMLECPECKSAFALDKTDFKVNKDRLMMVCPKCHKQVAPEIKDSNTTDPTDIKPILWDSLNMKVEYDELLGNSQYFYSIPGSIATALNKGDQNLWSTYPLYLIKAARQKKLLKLFPDKILHLRRDTHSSSYNKGYGQPIVSPVLKYLFHLLVLMRAQDALAIDQILPWTIISPSSNGSVDPSGDLDLGQYSTALEKEYQEWKKNPMRKSVMPIPVNAQIVGAQGKALMLVNEIQEMTNQVLAGMGVPNEFVYGGLQWSGANISLRMLENQCINYRNMMQQVLDYIVEYCHTYFNLPLIKVHMQAFKMADDVAQKELLLNLSQAGIISKQTMLKELFPNISFDEERQKIKEENASEQQAMIEAEIHNRNTQMMYGVQGPNPAQAQMQQQQDDSGNESGQKHKDLPEDKPPRAEGGKAQV